MTTLKKFNNHRASWTYKQIRNPENVAKFLADGWKIA